MKKVVLVSVLALSTMFVNAQVTFGVKGGVNFATLVVMMLMNWKAKSLIPAFTSVVL